MSGDPIDEVVDLTQHINEAAAEAARWHQRWVLSLGIANGTALLALINMMGDPARRTIETIVPAFLYLAGVICAGAVPPTSAYAAGFKLRAMSINRSIIHDGAQHGGGADAELSSEVQLLASKLKKATILAVSLEWGSAIFFVLGSLLALLIVAWRALC